ncbi:MAG: SDR family oxidoreductase [Puniceicoccaceae bacterium]
MSTFLNEQFALNDQRILITGGYRGLGLAMARGLALAGAEVALNGRSGEKVEEAVACLRDQGLKAHAAVFDISDEESVTRGVEELRQSMGPVTVLFNNAGIHRRNLLEDMSLEDFRTVIDTNLTAAFLVARTVVTDMFSAGGGKIINTCSLMSELARPSTGNYAAAKGGLKMLTRAMAAEWAGRNIQINAIAPGYFVTELTEALKADPKFDGWICGRTPAGRWGVPDELAGVAVFLASRASSFVNGQMLLVDGGLSSVI